MTSGVPPLGVETCTGNFLPVDAITEAQVRARLGSDAPADALSRLGLRHTPEAQAALVAFADLIVHECLRANARGRDDPIDSAMRRAQRHAVFAARLLRNMYSSTERTARLFLRHTDPLFITAPGGRAALVCVRHLPCWAIAINRDLGDTSEDGNDRPLWSMACRRSAAKFTEALARLGKLASSPIHPVALPLLPLQALWTWPPAMATAVTHGTPLIERERLLAQEAAVSAGKRAATAQHTQEHAARVSVARALRFARALKAPADAVQLAQAANHVLHARPAAVRAEATATLSDAEVDALLKAAGASATRARSAVSLDALRRAWARRALDTYSRWRHEDVADAEGDDVALALAKLSIGAPVKGEETQEFYVPYGLSLGASPLAGNNSAASELRVWTRSMAWTPAAAAASGGLTLEARLCTPYDGVLTDSDARRTHAHPYVLTLDHAKRTLGVPINLEPLDDQLPSAGNGDRVRCIAFTAERLCQGLQCATAYGASVVTIDVGETVKDNATLARRFAAALALALGMLPNTVAQTVAVRVQEPTNEFNTQQRELNTAAAALSAVLPTLALGEAAAAVAAVVG